MLTQESIKEIANGFQKSRVLLTGYELGLFTALENKSKTAAEIAKDLRTNTEAEVKGWMEE